jgi:lysine 2,3-aminomutase
MKSDANTANDTEPPNAPFPFSATLDEEEMLPSAFAGSPRPARRRPADPVVSARAEWFRRRFFPDTDARDWSDWRWQVRNRICTLDGLARHVSLSEDEVAAWRGTRDALPLAITPYYMSLVDPADPSQPIRRSVVPTSAERVRGPGEADDPLHEEGDSPIPGLVHRYPDRVLLMATDFCSTNCRYCTRSRLVGRQRLRGCRHARWQRAVDYIAAHEAIHDVIVSGGDPLTLPDREIDWLLSRLRAIPHLDVIRIGTKVPAVLPQRITSGLIRVLRRYHPLLMSLHFTHPDELTPESAEACGRLADAGIPLGSQTVLLRGINDDVSTMRSLFRGLLRSRVRPYYLYQCDPIPGSGHLRTPVETGLDVIRGLRGHMSGYAVPTYVIDAPGGGGKIPLLPSEFARREGDDVVLRNYAGREYRYPDVVGASVPLSLPYPVETHHVL